MKTKKIVIGLGNPGSEYNNTRHNTGFMLIDYLVKQKKLQPKITKNALFFFDTWDDKEIVYVKPLTFMNLSGTFVQEFVKNNAVNLENIVVIYDDLDLSVGTFKLKSSGSCGGHNGMRNIIDCCKTDKINRIKIGIRNENYDRTRKIEFVLGRFNKSEIVQLQTVFTKINEIVDQIIKFSFKYALNCYNNHEWHHSKI